MTFEEWFHKEYEPADLQIKQYAERNEGLHIPAKVYLEDLKKAFEAGITDLEKENAELKKENRLLKSLLYCTTRSCNNCGKVTCENFQRQRIDCCGNWVSYKDYIKQLEAQIEKMKCCENCAKRGHICVAEEMQGNLCGKNKDKWELRR